MTNPSPVGLPPDPARRRLLAAAAGALVLAGFSRPGRGEDPGQIRHPRGATRMNDTPAPRRTGYVFHPDFLAYELAPGHPESPARARAIQAAMQASGLVDRVLHLDPVAADVAEAALPRIHPEAHVASIRRHRAIHHAQALTGVAAALAVTDAVLAGRIDNGFSAARPPGHHALADGREEGFCYYNNVAIAAAHARAVHGVERILIVDWDYHHGNATEAAFYRDPHTLFFSTHDLHAYPWTGFPDRQGEGPGEGTNVNVPLPCGVDDAGILRAFDQRLLPLALAFRPELVFISAGFDSRIDDLLGCFAVTDRGFATLTERVLEIADRHSGGRVVSCLEGGYLPEGNASATVHHVAALLGVPPNLEPPARRGRPGPRL